MKPERTWEVVAEELSKEMDGQRVLELARELNRLLEKKEKNKRRTVGAAGESRTRMPGGAGF
jgi:hypothetical protein